MNIAPLQSVRPIHRRGFTMVELLVVLGILILITASTMLVIDHNDDQVRFEKSREGYRELSTAMFGPSQLTTISGNLVISGYLADTGTLPVTLADLTVKPPSIPAWGMVVSRDLGGRVFQGWRGPYVAAGEDGVLRDSWGNPWRYVNNLGGTQLELGSTGRDGMPGGASQYENDYPVDPILKSGYYKLDAVPIPQRRIQKASTGTLTVYVGALHAGLYPATANWSPTHASLLRYPNGTVVTLTLGSTGGGSSSSGSSSSSTTTLPANLTYNLGYARQLQLVLYNAAKNGTKLIDKLYSADQPVYSYLPRVSSVGQQAASDVAGSDTWVTP